MPAQTVHESVDLLLPFAITVTYSRFALSPSTPLILSLSKDERRSDRPVEGRTPRSWFDKLTTSRNVTVIMKCCT